MHFTITVEVDIQRIQGKFASKDEMEAQIIDAIESANPDSLTGDNEGEYEVTNWEVTTHEQS
jgi:hypothetical protein